MLLNTMTYDTCKINDISGWPNQVRLVKNTIVVWEMIGKYFCLHRYSQNNFEALLKVLYPNNIYYQN